MQNKLTMPNEKTMPLWRHLMRGVVAVWLLSGVHPVMAESVSVTSTFVPGPTCDNGTGVDVSGAGCFSDSDNQRRVWSDANTYCAGLGGGYVLPSRDQLLALYNAYPDNQMGAWGWITDYGYWSSTEFSVDNHYIVDLSDGFSEGLVDSNARYVTCVRAP